MAPYYRMFGKLVTALKHKEKRLGAYDPRRLLISHPINLMHLTLEYNRLRFD